MRVQLIAQEVWNGLRRNLSVVVSVVLVTFISLSFVGAAILFSWLDWRELRRRGVPLPFHWAWALLALASGGLAVYIIGELAELESLPHVAGVASMKDAERTRRVIDEVTSLLDAPRPAMLVIDGWHALDADLREPLARIASEGPDAGIHLVVTTQRWSAIRPNVRGSENGMSSRRNTSKMLVHAAGFSNGWEALVLKNPPPFVPSSLIASWLATGPPGAPGFAA